MNTKNQKYPPRENHPWKTSYKVNLTRRLNGEAENLPKIKELYIFLSELVTNWTTFQVNADSLDFPASDIIKNLSDKQKAEWLLDFLNRYYINKERW